ncbi:MAG: O-antigen ligase family protein, partial [Gammaproteobacteria bacterium]
AGEDKTSQLRMTYWMDGLDMIADNPVIGVGFGNWLPYYGEHYGATGIEFRADYELPHNIFIYAGAELGLVGLGVFLVMVLATFVINARTRAQARRNRDRFSELMAHGLDAGMIGFLVAGQFVTILYYPFFWVQASFAVALNRAVLAPAAPDVATEARSPTKRAAVARQDQRRSPGMLASRVRSPGA